MSTFLQQFVDALNADTTGALKALSDALIADPKKARPTVEASLFTAGGSGTDPIGEVEALILNNPAAQTALEARLFKDDAFLSQTLSEGDANNVKTILTTVAVKATQGVVAQLLADANSAAFLAAIASSDGGTLKKFIDGLRENATTGPVVIDEIIESIAKATLRPSDGAKFQKDPPMTELIGLLGADSSRDAFVGALLAPGKVHDAIVGKLTATPDDLIASLLKDHTGQLLDALLAVETTGGARDQLFARIAVPPKLQTLAAAAIRKGAADTTATATAAGDNAAVASGNGEKFLHPTVEVLGQSDEFLDDLAATFPTFNAKAAISRFLAAFIRNADAPADFAKALTDHAEARAAFVGVIGAAVTAVPGLKTPIQSKVNP